MKTMTLLFAMLLAAVLGCGKKVEPRHIVILPDVSGSIDRKALEQAFKAIDELVGQLHRGDRIVIIPILGDAQAEASGRIIRFEVPKERRAYDADLRDFRRRLSTGLAEMRANAIAHPGSKTDILGSVALAVQELNMMPSGPQRLLVILSDFIQEDAQVDFRKDKRMADKNLATAFAQYNVQTDSLNLSGTRIYLGLLQSAEYANLSRLRRQAIKAFWVIIYLAHLTA